MYFYPSTNNNERPKASEYCCPEGNGNGHWLHCYLLIIVQIVFILTFAAQTCGATKVRVQMCATDVPYFLIDFAN
jgi:hypothetical protein